MNINEQSQAVLLLTAWFTKPQKGEPKPLSPTEWGRFSQFLLDSGLTPETLLNSNNPGQFLEKWTDRTIDAERIQYLLGRSGALGFSLEKWHRAGLWVMIRSDPDYPSRLKRHLKFDAPPVLFGCGNRQLLNQRGIAVIGSRDASPEDLNFTKHLGCEIANQGYSVVSGGARGVDESAMLGALEHEGTTVGILADSLLRASNSSRYRQAVMDRNLVLVSPFNPEAGFDVGNAMARNKYIYCMANAAVVICTAKGKGGTWSGATENLKRGWTPLWVKKDSDKSSGNSALVKLGAQWLPNSPLDLPSLIANVNEPVSGTLLEPNNQSSDLLFEKIVASELVVVKAEDETQVVTNLNKLPDEDSLSEVLPTSIEPLPVESKVTNNDSSQFNLSLYEYFLHKLEQETALKALSLESLQDKLGLGKSQLTEWLKRAIAEGLVEKYGKPACYRTTRMQRLF